MSIYITRQMLDPNFQTQKASERFGILRQWSRSVVRKWRRRKLIAALEALDDRLLRDIGIYRGDIKRRVDGFDDRELRMVPLAPAQMTPRPGYEARKEAA